ncbi:epsin-2-like [Phoenix dactylifera]|uniref:Epsin-2-like n=1 Tax=Phoenix dactylifera TaxID=42345 RepID=A0A8B7CN48_PHODC|nr:epsin-2-like [Phoenix dactylifera]
MSIAMGTPFFHELRKQASYFFKEKIRTARLALTDVTPAELLTEEATNGNPWAPDARTMGFISRAAFEIDDYWRIVEILHKRLAKFDRKHWREPYKALILLEHLLTHGPESTAEEFQSDKEVIQEMENFQFIDERGFNWGLTVRKKSERVLKLLEKGPVLTEERDQARRITRGIQGFGSFNLSWSSTNKNGIEQASNCYGRSNSHYEGYSQQEDIVPDSQKENLSPDDRLDLQMNKKTESGERLMKENSVDKSLPKKGLPPRESRPLLTCQEGMKNEFQREDHPFNKLEYQSMESRLLLSRNSV